MHWDPIGFNNVGHGQSVEPAPGLFSVRVAFPRTRQMSGQYTRTLRGKVMVIDLVCIECHIKPSKWPLLRRCTYQVSYKYIHHRIRHICWWVVCIMSIIKQFRSYHPPPHTNTPTNTVVLLCLTFLYTFTILNCVVKLFSSVKIDCLNPISPRQLHMCYHVGEATSKAGLTTWDGWHA